MTRHYELAQVSGHAWAAIALPAGGAVGNAGIVGLDGGRSIVVDAGFTPAAGAELREAAERLAGPVERLVVTHADFDHYGGSAAFADVPIVASERTRTAITDNGLARIAELRSGMQDHLAELAEKGAPEWEQEQARLISYELPSLEVMVPTEPFTGEIELGGVTVLECGANHTASDAVAWFASERVLVAADLVGVETHLNLTRGDPENWLRTLDRLAAFGPERIVPGHGPAAGPESIATARRYIEELLELARLPGDHPMPAEYRDWEFAHGWELNLSALRERHAPETATA